MRSVKIIRRAFAVLLSLALCAVPLAFAPTASVAADYSSDMMVRVGIVYGTSVAGSYTVKVDNGISVGIMTDKRTFMKLGEFPSVRTATVTLQKNTTVGGKTVGNHHLQLSGSFTSYAKAYAEVKEMRKAGIAAYVAYINDTFRVRTGAYASADAAKSAKNSLKGGYSSKVSVVSGGGGGTMIYDNSSKTVIFEAEGFSAGIRALQLSGDDKTYYIKAPSGNLYDGVFEFSKYGSGVAVTNVLDLDTYALGVLPWEIYPTWPQETLNAFAITVRTLAVYHYGARHNSAYGFDVCPTSHCQNYKGMTRDYASLRQAVAATAGEIAVYDGKAIMGIYCGTNGGVTEDVRDIWGGNVYYPYLTSVTIPLEVESCVNQPSGVWQSVVTPKELSDYFVKDGSYDALKKLTSPIVALNVKRYSKYSGVYIYELEFVDSAGHTASVSTSSKVRGSLVKYCKSAYFSISYNYDFAMQTASGVKSAAVNSSAATVLTAGGEHSLGEATPATLSVLTASGKKTVSTDKFTIQFDGKGNGHGGGISMYGAVDLANAGYTCDEILKTYFPGIDVLALGVPEKQTDYADDGVDDGDDTDIGVPDEEFTPCVDGIITTTAVNLRAEPNTSSGVIKQLAKGTVLLRTGYGSDGWERVFYNGGVAYIYSQYTSACDAPETEGFAYVFEGVTATDAVNVRAAPNTDSAVITTVGESAALTRVGVGTAEIGFDMVLLDSGMIGYVTKAAIVKDETGDSFAEASDLVTATDTVNLRAAPDLTSDVLETVAKGTVLARTGIGEGDFDRVLTPSGKTAYVMKRYVSEKVSADEYTPADDKVVTTETVNARKDASTSAAIITQVKKGTLLTRTGIGNGWDRVLLENGVTAYIKSEYLAPDPNSDPNGVFENVRDTVVTTDAVNLREGASTSTKVLAQVKKGTELVRTGIGGDGWDRVLTPSGATAYVYKLYITEADDGFEKVNDTVTATAQVNLREGPSTDAAIITRVNKGTILTRTGIGKDGWDRVLAPDGTTAYVSKEYVK